MQSSLWGNVMQTAIANELAEANRLKRLELSKSHDLIVGVLQDRVGEV